MGYYTQFSLQIQQGTLEQAGQCFEHLRNVSAYNIRSEGMTAETSEVKWYDCHQDCLQATMLVPEVLLRVEGVGEEYPDHWVRWYKDGEVVGKWSLKVESPQTLADLCLTIS